MPNSFAQVPLDEIFDRALSIARDIDCSVYDALHIASAERWETHVVTADRKLVAKVSGSKYQSYVRGI